MSIIQYYSDDYAGLEIDDYRFYYGYEKEDPITEEWLFVVEKNNEEIYHLTTTYIENNCETKQLRAPQDYLLVGISVWLLNNDKL